MLGRAHCVREDGEARLDAREDLAGLLGREGVGDVVEELGIEGLVDEDVDARAERDEVVRTPRVSRQRDRAPRVVHGEGDGSTPSSGATKAMTCTAAGSRRPSDSAVCSS